MQHQQPLRSARRSGCWENAAMKRRRRGSNGYGCIVQRGTNGQSLIPRCDEASGVAALFPLFFLLEEMRAQGASVEAYRKAVGEGYRTGRLRRRALAVCPTCDSTDAYFITDSGQRVAFTPPRHDLLAQLQRAGPWCSHARGRPRHACEPARSGIAGVSFSLSTRRPKPRAR